MQRQVCCTALAAGLAPPCPLPACPPACLRARRFLPRPGVERARRVLRLGLQALSPHFCLARGMHLVSGTGRLWLEVDVVGVTVW
jgi:hypothetical protein